MLTERALTQAKRNELARDMAALRRLAGTPRALCTPRPRTAPQLRPFARSRKVQP